MPDKEKLPFLTWHPQEAWQHGR